MATRRLNVRLQRGEALRVTRLMIGSQKLVYVIVADKKLGYPRGRSRIAYIGTTQNGASRVAKSAADRADKVLRLHGVYECHSRVITCRPRQKVKTWLKLERGFLLAFREHFGRVPYCNTQGKGIKEHDEWEYFAKGRLLRIIEDLS